MRYIVILLLAVLPYSLSFGQSARKFNRLGERALAENDLASANIYFDSAKTIQPHQPLYWFNYAESLFLLEQYYRAIDAYQTAIENDDENNYTTAYLKLAKAYQYAGEYEKADKVYESVLQKGKRFPVYRQALKAQKQSLEVAKLFSNPVDIQLDTVEIENIGSLYNPVVINDSIFFTALYKPKDEMILNQQNYAIPVGNPNKKASIEDASIFVYHPDSLIRYTTLTIKNEKRICVSNYDNGIWTIPEPLLALNSFNDCFQPNIATVKNKTYLLFTSSDPQAVQHQGGTDVYWMEIKLRKRKISYGVPKNMGRKINTAENEITPYYSEEYKELWFSSNGLPGLGNFDLFKAKVKGRSIGKPVNMGFPINTYHSEINPFSIDSTVYFISDRNLHKDCFETVEFLRCNELFKFEYIDSIPSKDTNSMELPPIELDLNTQLTSVDLLPLNLYFDNDQPNPNSRQTTTQFSWEQLYTDYELMREEYKTNSDTKGDVDAFFKYTLPTSLTDLDSLATIISVSLQQGNEVHLGMKGFASALAASNYNENLSKRRLNSVENYFAQYNQGELAPYIAQGKLVFNRLPQGEIKSQSSLDDLSQKSKSVYGINAIVWRKVEISWIEVLAENDTLGNIVFSEYYVDLGSYSKDTTITFQIDIDNPTEQLVQIDSIATSCPCLTASSADNFDIEPGGRETVQFSLAVDPLQKGPIEQYIKVYNSGRYPEKRILIQYWVK